MDFNTINVGVEGPAGVLTLARPAKLNAVSFELLRELRTAVEMLEADPQVKGIIITGSEKSFSTGADLSEAVTVDTGVKFLAYNRLWRDATYAMEHCTKPIIAAVNGYCLTGGLEIALACDIRLASEGARFGITSSKIGSVAGAGGTQRLPRIVGVAVAMELLFTSRHIGAEEAARIGLVNRVTDGDAVTDAKEMVEVFANRGPLSLAFMKRAVQSGVNVDIESSLDYEAVLSGLAFSSRDKTEGMTVFLEKREPQFNGS